MPSSPDNCPNHRHRNPRAEELLLARISEAAGREHLGRRRATYPGVVFIRPRRLRWIRLRRTVTTTRLDLYEHGLTVAARGRIRVIRYDATSLHQSSEYCHVLTDVTGTEITLCERDYRQPEIWLAEIRCSINPLRP